MYKTVPTTTAAAVVAAIMRIADEDEGHVGDDDDDDDGDGIVKINKLCVYIVSECVYYTMSRQDSIGPGVIDMTEMIIIDL